MSLMPLEQLEAAAADREALQRELAGGEPQQGPQLQAQDYLVQELLAWFKGKFFTWVSCADAVLAGQLE
jgi:hypothetical protein